MREEKLESIFGLMAGTVWDSLNRNGSSTINDIVKSTGLRRELVYGALGWLGRENKLIAERHGKGLIFTLRDKKITSKTFSGTASEPIPSMIKNALRFILSEFRANREPTPTQVSRAAGMGKQLGKALSKLGIKSKPVRRDGKSYRVYPLSYESEIRKLISQ